MKNTLARRTSILCVDDDTKLCTYRAVTDDSTGFTSRFFISLLACNIIRERMGRMNITELIIKYISMNI